MKTNFVSDCQNKLPLYDIQKTVSSQEDLIMLHINNKGSEELVHLCSPIRVLFILSLESITAKLATVQYSIKSL